jgi:Rrf2 family protein
MRLALTKQAEYALRILMWLASGEAADRASGAAPARQKAADIAAANDVPPVFATRVLALLQRQGLLLARAGQQGGYTLGRTSEDISLLEVVESIEGPLVTRECVLRDGLCGTEGYCLLHDAWSAAREALCAVLASTTLAGALTQRAGTETGVATLAGLRPLAFAKSVSNGAVRATEDA